MAVANGSPQQPHIPAWKRLGLKLKYAKDTADPPPNQGNTGKIDESTPITPGTTEDEPPSKKRKTSPPSDSLSDSHSKSLAPNSSEKSTAQTGAITEVESTSAKPSVETEAVPVPSHSGQPVPDNRRAGTIKRRKSVSFTGETKKNDGNSTQAFSDPPSHSDLADAEDRTADAPSGASSSKDQNLKKAKQSTEVQSTKKEKTQSKSEKKQKKSGSKEQPAGIPEYVRYLEQFYNDQGSWKFNKNHQNALLKNLFNIRIVSASLTAAIASYIEGLKGVGPRQRVGENATAILRKVAEKDGSLDEIDAMNTESARRKAFFEARRREFEKFERAGMPRGEQDDNELAEMKEEMERGERAEAVLLALAKSEANSPAVSSSTASKQSANADGGDFSSTSAAGSVNTSQPKTTARKKRKKRTDISSDSSSSDSSSDSDSDSDAAPPPPKEGPKTVKEALRPTPAPAPKYQPKNSPPAKRTPAYQHGDPNIAYRPQNPSQLMDMSAKPKKTIFDDELLDKAFPTTKTYNQSAPKRKRDERETGKRGDKKAKRGYAYQHGNVQDESGSESE